MGHVGRDKLVLMCGGAVVVGITAFVGYRMYSNAKNVHKSQQNALKSFEVVDFNNGEVKVCYLFFHSFIPLPNV
jgi:hypothetical protein